MKYIFLFAWSIFKRIAWLILGVILSINLVFDRILKTLTIVLIFTYDLKLKKQYKWWKQYHLWMPGPMCLIGFEFNNLDDYIKLKNSRRIII